MIKCEIEFDNKFSSPLSPKEFIELYVFRENVLLNREVRRVIKEHMGKQIVSEELDLEYRVMVSNDREVMIIRMKNVRQE